MAEQTALDQKTGILPRILPGILVFFLTTWLVKVSPATMVYRGSGDGLSRF